MGKPGLVVPSERDFVQSEVIGGDLAKMVNVILTDANAVNCVGDWECVESTPEEFEGKSAVLTSSTSGQVHSLKVLLVGDSFRGAIKRYLAEDFEECLIMHRNDFDLEAITR